MLKDPDEVRKDSSLAINGGVPRQRTPAEDEGICPEAADDVAAIVRTGRTTVWGGGPKAKELESRFAALIGRGGAFFHNSGTAALLTGLFALDVDAGSTVAISDSGFVSSLNVVYYRAARPVFLPTDQRTLVCQSDVSEWVDEPPDVALLTHFLGNVVDVEAVMRSTGSARLHEDASQALGAQLNGRSVGAFGDVATFAGSHRKLLGAGQGGLNVYDDPAMGRKMRILSHHGKADRQVGEVPGFNFRGGDMEATLALAALDRLEARAEARVATAAAMSAIFGEAGLTTAVSAPDLDCRPVWFDVALILPEEWIPHRDWLVAALDAEGVPAWQYPALIEMPWLKPWMRSRRWWGEREEELLARETALWSRVIVIATQMAPTDAPRTAAITADVLTR
ncbi:MAG: DegT/DnrJ/EryC1/StrS family aminotransferase [Pseudonocardiaceae bacterium]